MAMSCEERGILHLLKMYVIFQEVEADDGNMKLANLSCIGPTN